jgi:hypothetical protein
LSKLVKRSGPVGEQLSLMREQEMPALRQEWLAPW